MFRNRRNSMTTNGCIIMAVFILWVGISWAVNFYKLTSCDFESPYKCEVVHGVGILPPVALITSWYDFNEN